MSEQRAKFPKSEKTVDQLQDEFRVLNEQAQEIQVKLAKVAERIAQRDDGRLISHSDPASIETVEF